MSAALHYALPSMSSDPQRPADDPAAESSDPHPRDLQDLVLHLDFVPTWARKPADNPFVEARDRGDAPRPRAPGPGRDRRERDHGPRPDRRGGAPKGKGRRFDGERGARGGPPPLRPARLPLEVAFLPERRQLGALVRQLNAAQKAFPLSYLAGLLLAKPDYHLLKVEVRGATVHLLQCAADGALFAEPEALRAHVISRHLDLEFDVSEVTGDPPSGNFTSVGRCRLSGEWLGPPNYHGYNERMLDLQRTRFPHMTLDAYRAQVEIVRDPAAIEAWKETCRVQKVYRRKGQADAPPLKREEAVQQFLQHRLAALTRSGTRFIVPAASLRDLPDSPLKTALSEAWSRESRFPLSLMLALRPAFKRMRLHLFKAGRGETFVTAIPPRPLDAAHAVEPIRAMLALIREHPGWNRAQLVEHLSPGTAPASEAGTALLAPLRWLIEKGHVIEFFNGTLSAPSLQGAGAAESAPAPEPVAEAPADVSDAEIRADATESPPPAAPEADASQRA